jgi:hypothetical protein
LAGFDSSAAEAATSAQTLLDILRTLECELHEQATRQDANRLNELLHHEFKEFGSSGNAYARTEIIGLLTSAEQAPRIEAQDFRVQSLAPGVALLTYKSAQTSALVRVAARSLGLATGVSSGHTDRGI